MAILDAYGRRVGTTDPSWTDLLAGELRRIAAKPLPFGPILYGADGRLAHSDKGQVLRFTRYENLPGKEVE